MPGKPDYIRKKFAPLLDKTLTNALAHRIKKEFPRMGGNRICKLCAEMVLEVVNAHLRPRESIRHGQIIWMAISVDDPPARGKRTADTEMIPVMLDLVADEDIEAYLDHKRPDQRLETKAVRLSR